MVVGLGVRGWRLGGVRFLFSVFRSVIRRYASFFSLRRFFRVARYIRIGGSSKRIVLFTRTNNDRIRRFRATLRRFIMNSIIRLHNYQILLQINNMSTIRANAFRRSVHLGLSTTRAKANVNDRRQVTYANKRSSCFTYFRAFSNAPFVMRFASKFRACNDRRTNLRTNDCRDQARYGTISSNYRRSRLITFRAIRPFINATRSTRGISATCRSTCLCSRFISFFSLDYMLNGTFLISTMLLFARRTLTTRFRWSSFVNYRGV